MLYTPYWRSFPPGTEELNSRLDWSESTPVVGNCVSMPSVYFCIKARPAKNFLIGSYKGCREIEGGCHNHAVCRVTMKIFQ